MLYRAFLVRNLPESKTLDFVAMDKADSANVRPFYCPRSKVLAMRELDSMSQEISCDIGIHVGIPMEIEIDDTFAARVGLV